MTTRKKYTYKAAWVAFAEKGDFAKMNKLRAIINKKTATSPTERAVVSTIVQHLFEEKNEKELADLFVAAHNIAAKEAQAKAAAEKEAKEAEELAELKKRVAELEAKKR